MTRTEIETFVKKLDDLDTLELVDELMRQEKLNIWSYLERKPLTRNTLLGYELDFWNITFKK